MAEEPESAGEWCTVAEAARAFGVTERAIRRRVERGTLESRRAMAGNRVLTLVRLPPEVEPEPRAEPRRHAPDAAELAALRQNLDDLRAEVQWLRAELERRTWRWPGLWPALRRFWRGHE